MRVLFVGMYCFCIGSAVIVTFQTPSMKEKAISSLTCLCLLLSLISHFVHLAIQHALCVAAVWCWVLATGLVLACFRQATNVGKPQIKDI